MAFDFGLRQIGVAVGQTLTKSANPVAILQAKEGKPDWSHIEKLVKEWQPNLLLVGLPLNMDGTTSEMSDRAKKFANRLHGRLGLPIELVDERLSSFEARQQLAAQDKKFAHDKIDNIAATLILASWLEHQ